MTSSADATVHDITYGGPQGPVAAYLVVPTGSGPYAGVLFMHWLDDAAHGDRREFLAEATRLAGRGVVSILPQGSFPWGNPPSGFERDQARIEAQVAEMQAAVDLLKAQPGVDASRIALVGHDYGAMHGSVLAGRTQAFAALVLMAPTPRYVTWFAQYWRFLKSEAEVAAYAERMAPLDPRTNLPKAGPAPVLLQFANQDQYVKQNDVDEMAAAAGGRATVRTYDSGHQLNEAAAADRARWLEDQLRI